MLSILEVDNCFYLLSLVLKLCSNCEIQLMVEQKWPQHSLHCCMQNMQEKPMLAYVSAALIEWLWYIWWLLMDRSECVRVLYSFLHFYQAASRSGEWGMRSWEGQKGTRRTPFRDMKGNDPSCCCTWREKGRQATVGRRSLKSRGQVFNLNVSKGRTPSHLPLPSSSPLSWPLHSHSTQWKMLMNSKDRAPTSRTQARQFFTVKCCVWSHLATPPKLRGNVLFGEFPKSRPVTWKHLGLFFLPVLSSFSHRRRPHFVLPANVTQFLWHAATGHHKSTHLTMGPQIYQPECFESGGHIMTCKEVEGALSHASAAPCLDLRLILLQPAGKPDATKAPGPHQFHKQSY